MDFINKQDDVAGFLQLVHDGLHALFELAAVLGAGHEGSEVQHDDALVEQRARHAALDDAQRQALDDSCFAHARLADKDRVVLFAAAQDLGHPFDLVFTADNGVQAALLSQFRDIAPEVIEHGSTGLRVRFALLEATGLLVLVVGVFRVGRCLVKRFGRIHILFLPDVLQLCFVDIVVNVELGQDLRSRVILVLEDREQQVFRAYLFAFQHLGLQKGHFEHFFGLFVQRQGAYVQLGARCWYFLDGILQHLFQFAGIHIEGFQHLDGKAVLFRHDTQHEVLGADKIMAQANRFFTAAGDDLFDFW